MIIKQNMLISCSSDKSIKIWNLNNNTLHKVINNAHNGKYIYSLLLIKEIDLIISGGFDSYIRFWDNNYKELDTNINNRSPVNYMLQFKEILIVGDDDKTIKFYNLNTKDLLNKIITDHSEFIWRLLLLNTNDIILSGSKDSTIKVWNIKDFKTKNSLNNNKCITKISNHKGCIESLLQLDYDNNILVSTDRNGTIVFSSINNNYQIINKYEISHYDKNPDKSDNNPMHIYELRKFKLLISITCGSSLLFWNLSDYQIIRNVSFHKRLRTIIGLENEEGMIFSQGNENNIVIWK